MMNDPLKPCPFCGGTDLYIDGGEYLQDFEVLCVKCGGRIAYFDTRAEAISAWNRRAYEDKLRENLLKIIDAMRFIPLDEDEQGPKGILLRVVAELWPEEDGDSDEGTNDR